MTRFVTSLLVFALTAGIVATQPPEEKKKGRPAGQQKGPPPFELGRVLPPGVRDELGLTLEQQQALQEIEKDVRDKLNRLLTEQQRKVIDSFRPRRPAEPEPERGPPVRRETRGEPGPRLLVGAPLRLVTPGNKKAYALEGDAVEGELGDVQKEISGRGVRFLSAVNDRQGEGMIAFTVTGLKPEQGRWYRLRIRALAQEDFHVEKDDLYLRVDFFKDAGASALDFVKKSIYEQVERERKDLADAGTNRNLGSATWRNYLLDFRTPFPEVDTLRLTAGFAHGKPRGPRGEFWISEVEVGAIAVPADYVPPTRAATNPPPLDKLVKLGGRWYFDPRGGDPVPPQFDHANADRLYYLTDRLEAPFAGNMTSWLRPGYLDRAGKMVDEDRFVPDNVVVSFTDKHLIIKSHNLPNHPTAVFPDRWRLLDGNPNYIQEQDHTWYIPLEPKVNPNHVAIDAQNGNKALPGGPIGVAINGVNFYNPFDEHLSKDAVWRLDRCCGHPSPGQSYHYHKYPSCVNTPWADDGERHSPLLGFAFDGFPVYGPYEAAGTLAKDVKTNALNAFNVHHDEQRGWHYHVTLGKYPHLLGGFWGTMDPRNRGKKAPPPG
jgi:hypothetical protein